MYVVRKIFSLLLINASACMLLAACHGSSSTSSTIPPTVSFSCPVTASNTLAITCTGTSVTSDGSAATFSWNFGDSGTATVNPTAHTYSAPGVYLVKLIVADDHGTTAEAQQSVTVTGGVASALENWSWLNGSETANSFGDYATTVSPSAANQPSSRQGAVSWTNNSQGKLWLFGGTGYDSTGVQGQLNDLWVYNTTLQQWAWVGGTNKANTWGVYGTQGVPSAANAPGGRVGAASWTDSSGNFWLFGGNGYDIIGTVGSMADMWEINPLTGESTWISGPTIANQTGTSSSPASRYYPTTWTDANGNFWLFGGQTNILNVAGGVTLNDLWMFNPSTKVWTQKGGSVTASNAAGVYGTVGTGSTTNLPGARTSAQSWTDKSGTLWLFGGSGYDANDASGALNDMWSYNTSTGVWTWISGSKTVVAAGVYGTQGTTGTANTPSARAGSVGWADTNGNLWLFGGGDFNTLGIIAGAIPGAITGNELNDLWSFNTTTKLWTWVAGPSTAGGSGIFPATVGAGNASPYNTPGARGWGVGWLDASGKFWLFSGSGIDGSGAVGNLNDLWSVQPAQQ